MIGENRKPRAILGAAKQVRLDRFQRVGEPWQAALWDIYETLGPVHYGMTFKQAAAQRITYYAAEIVNPFEEPKPTENPAALQAVEALGDLSQIVGQFTVQTNVAGEGYLWGEEDDEFQVLSTVEVNEKQRDDMSPEDFLLRIWKPSPKKHSEPDSPLRSVQAQCEQLLLLNDQVGATAMSRIPAGFFLVPDELSFAFNPTENATDDPFTAELIEVITTAIKDPDSAARVAPNVIRGAAEYLKEVRYLDISREMDQVFAGMREELLRQIAGGINLPAEILTGLADLNHWSLWGVDESTAKHHVDPDVLQVLQGLTDGYLHPYLEEAGVDPTDFVIWRDYADLTARPLTVDQALALNEAGVVNDEYVRRVANVPEDMAGPGRPTVPEPSAPDDNRIPDTLVAAGPVNTRPLERIDADLATRITEASEAAFERAMERAGAKVRAKIRNDRTMSAAIDGVANLDVTRTLGQSRLTQFQLTPDQLVPGETFDNLESRIDALLAEGQEQTRTELANIFEQVVPPDPKEDEDRSAALSIFISLLLTAATARLFTDAPTVDPAEEGEFSDSIATAQMVVDLLTRTGGGSPDLPDSPRGLALGQRARAAFRDHGYRLESLTWKWGYYRIPRTPFEPHLSLNNNQVLSREDPRLNGRYPGDHQFCSCELVPTILPGDEVG